VIWPAGVAIWNPSSDAGMGRSLPGRHEVPSPHPRGRALPESAVPGDTPTFGAAPDEEVIPELGDPIPELPAIRLPLVPLAEAPPVPLRVAPLPAEEPSPPDDALAAPEPVVPESVSPSLARSPPQLAKPIAMASAASPQWRSFGRVNGSPGRPTVPTGSGPATGRRPHRFDWGALRRLARDWGSAFRARTPRTSRASPRESRDTRRPRGCTSRSCSRIPRTSASCPSCCCTCRTT
jgi:hypothetical protein